MRQPTARFLKHLLLRTYVLIHRVRRFNFSFTLRRVLSSCLSCSNYSSCLASSQWKLSVDPVHCCLLVESYSTKTSGLNCLTTMKSSSDSELVSWTEAALAHLQYNLACRQRSALRLPLTPPRSSSLCDSSSHNWSMTEPSCLSDRASEPEQRLARLVEKRYSRPVNALLRTVDWMCK